MGCAAAKQAPDVVEGATSSQERIPMQQLPLATVSLRRSTILEGTDLISPRVSFSVSTAPPPPPGPCPESPPSTGAEDQPLLCVAFAVCDFHAEEADELSVLQGTFVAIVEEGEWPAPPGWCRCRRWLKDGQDEHGLVPWSHLVSAAHAEVCAVSGDAVDELPSTATLESPPPSRKEATQAAADTEAPRRAPPTTRHLGIRAPRLAHIEQGARVRHERHDVCVRRGARGLGIDVDERNCIVRSM